MSTSSGFLKMRLITTNAPGTVRASNESPTCRGQNSVRPLRSSHSEERTLRPCVSKRVLAQMKYGGTEPSLGDNEVGGYNRVSEVVAEMTASCVRGTAICD
jgi:hypothetical protein